ncbi:MAG: hypothetical protein ACKOCM_00360 [Cyanobacteriota bacterium]
MSCDARSLERLQALGRQLPQPLPRPDSTAAAAPRSQPRLHAIERESDPDQLFRELMQASPDGTVPPHLLERLRDLESARIQAPRASAALRAEQSPAQSTAATPRRPGGSGKTTRGSRPSAISADERSLYDAFEDLLHLQEEEERDPEPSIRQDRRPRSPQIQLQPKPTQRLAQEGR